jgi:hypothetical protein
MAEVKAMIENGDGDMDGRGRGRSKGKVAIQADVFVKRKLSLAETLCFYSKT